jgi:diguanylate cyclase
MAIFKKNIWLIFYVLTLFFLFFFTVLCYESWKILYNDYKTTQENMVKLLAESTDSLFKVQETVLNIVGNRFLEDPHYIDSPKSVTTLNSTLKDNPSMEAISLVTPQGEITFVSGGYDVSRFPNLLQQEVSRDSFLQTLQSHKMVFGRTYYSVPIKQWIVPIRKAIRDENGSIVTIIAAALRVNDAFGKHSHSFNHKHKYYISIVRETDFYFQYNNKKDDSKKYAVPISDNVRKNILQAIFDTQHITRDELRQNGSIASFVHVGLDSLKYLASLKYDTRYKLWISARIPYAFIQKDFFKKIGIYFLVFILIEIVLFFLFKIIAKAEDKRREDLLFQATHDSLTMLPNRTYLQKNIHRWFFEEAPAFSLFYIDMDHFKSINDNFGHQYGDFLLVELSKRLRLLTSEDEVVIRHGGDEFVIFTHITQVSALLSLGNSIIEAISKPYKINNFILSVGASIGIAKYPEHGNTLDMLFRAADIAMYESKKVKNNVQIFHNAMQENYLNSLIIEQELKKAVDNHELFMVYQPQIDTIGHIYGVEALVRWVNTTLGSVPPDKFIPIAENSGQMPKIGRFIINRTLDEIKEVQQTLGISFQTSINISVRQFMEVGFLEHFLEAIESTRLSQISITIEITENLMIEDMEYILPLLYEIRSHGIQISMDDFGTGYSSLSMLRKLPVDELKIDKSFIETIVEDIAAQKMVQNIIAIGKNLNMHVVAEGVETKEQRGLLSLFGCDRFQGYYFAKPLIKEDLISFIQTHEKDKTTL